MNITIVSYGLFPRNTPRANRATELAKELAKQGHNVILAGFLVKGFDYNRFEKKTNIKFVNLKKSYLERFACNEKFVVKFLYKFCFKLTNWLLEFPDIGLIWSVLDLFKKKECKNSDAVITIAMPYSLHWGMSFVKERPKIWIADCGDPFMKNPLRKPPFYFMFLEKKFCKSCDFITIPVKEAIDGYYKEFHSKIRVIPQGFDFTVSSDITNDVESRNKEITFLYAGSFYADLRDPRDFLDYLETLNIDFKFIIYTKDKFFIEKYRNSLGEKLIIRDYILREDLLEVMKGCDFLVNFENDSVIQSPSKLIDYALSNKPILSINSKNIDINIVEQFLNKNYVNKLVVKNIEDYNIVNVANSFLNLIKNRL